MKKLQTILEEVMDISRIPMQLYDAAGNCTAPGADIDAAVSESVHEFICSDAQNQSLGAFHYFKIICFDTLSYVLLVSNFAPDSFTVGRLTVCQLKHLLESQEESVTKSGFLRNLVNGSLTQEQWMADIKAASDQMRANLLSE